MQKKGLQEITNKGSTIKSSLRAALLAARGSNAEGEERKDSLWMESSPAAPALVGSDFSSNGGEVFDIDIEVLELPG
jgi:hypothetical protein